EKSGLLDSLFQRKVKPISDHVVSRMHDLAGTGAPPVLLSATCCDRTGAHSQHCGSKPICSHDSALHRFGRREATYSLSEAGASLVKTTGTPPRDSEQTHVCVFVTSTVTGTSLSGGIGSHRAFPFFLTFGQCAPYEGVRPRILGRAVSPAKPAGDAFTTRRHD